MTQMVLQGIVVAAWTWCLGIFVFVPPRNLWFIGMFTLILGNNIATLRRDIRKWKEFRAHDDA